MLLSTCVLFAGYTLSAQEIVPARTDADKTLSIKFQADAVGFDAPISIQELKAQKMARIAVNRDTAGALKAGYKVLSYTFTLISIKDGEQEAVRRIVCNGNSFGPIQSLLGLAKPGDFILFTDIKMEQPLPNPKNTPVLYIENYSATLIK